MIRAGLLALAGALAGVMAGQSALADCPAAPDPVFRLEQGSRYSDAGAGSRQLDAEADRAVDETLAPIDDFLRDLTRLANALLAAEADRAALADCVIGQMAVWARADAMGDLVTTAANLTAGSRLAAFGLVAEQVAPFVTAADDMAEVRIWLNRRQRAQMVFWETATKGAARGNLRAWSALAASAIGDLTDDAVMRGWAAWSASYVLCSANPDGSLPQEMTRGRLALHYQLHAIAPLSITAARLQRQGVPLAEECGAALRRAGDFIAGDLVDGARTAAITGAVQSFFDGSSEIAGFNLAWIEAWLTLYDSPQLDALAQPFRPLSHSKLGGDQTALWR